MLKFFIKEYGINNCSFLKLLKLVLDKKNFLEVLAEYVEADKKFMAPCTSGLSYSQIISALENSCLRNLHLGQRVSPKSMSRRIMSRVNWKSVFIGQLADI